MTTPRDTENNPPPLKIISLTAENVKRLKAVRIEPTSNVTVIGGRNEQGKTSVLDAIMMALGGKEALCELPVRKGEEKASIVVDLGEFVVTLKLTAAGGHALTVRSREGAKYSSPQSLLDGFVGTLSFDPLAFGRLKPAQQLETLRELVGVSTELIDSRRQATYEERTAVNREMKEREMELGKLEAVTVGKAEPTEEADLTALTNELEEAKAHNAANAKLREKLVNAERISGEWKMAVASAAKNVEDLRAQLKQAEETLAEAETKAKEADASLERGKGIVSALEDRDEESILARVRSFQAVSNLKAAFVQARAARAKVDELRKKSDELTQRIEQLNERKREKIASAEYPVDGLELGESGILLNGIPFEQASSAGRLKVSVAMGLAQHPRLKILLIRDGSLLDDDSLALIAAMAAEHDADVWIERVGHGKECSVIIEDGEVLEGGVE